MKGRTLFSIVVISLLSLTLLTMLGASSASSNTDNVHLINCSPNGVKEANINNDTMTVVVVCNEGDIEPTPEPTPTATPSPECDPHDNPLAFHEYLADPCDGSLAHSHDGNDIIGYECPFEVAPSGEGELFGDWRSILNAPDNQDFGFQHATIGEAENKAFGYNIMNGCDLPNTHGADVWITDFSYTNHRMPLVMANYVAVHSASLLARLSDGTVIIYAGWQDTGRLYVDGVHETLPTDTLIIPANDDPSFDRPYETQQHPASGNGRFGQADANGDLIFSNFWYSLNWRELPNKIGVEVGLPAEMRINGDVAPHIIALSISPEYAIGGHWTTDVYSCPLYGLCGDYYLPEAQQAAGTWYVSQPTSSGYYQLRVDGDMLTLNVGPGGNRTALPDYFSAVKSADIQRIPLPLPTQKE